ncbi:hypothetical protein G4B88_026478 [Cannabis sativa]|uniref:Uncharacterized protein n=1 Tax=Cannabis sativa TaxID=3483 RepID=A0A7J6GQJ5_CANSA|nr:hypothetical protein G4B88_026478 [Cannabis sativa]
MKKILKELTVMAGTIMLHLVALTRLSRLDGVMLKKMLLDDGQHGWYNVEFGSIDKITPTGWGDAEEDVARETSTPSMNPRNDGQHGKSGNTSFKDNFTMYMTIFHSYPRSDRKRMQSDFYNPRSSSPASIAAITGVSGKAKPELVVCATPI